MRERAGERSCAAAACAVRVVAERHSDRSAFSPGQADPPRFQRACCSASRSSFAHTWNCAPAPVSCDSIMVSRAGSPLGEGVSRIKYHIVRPIIVWKEVAGPTRCSHKMRLGPWELGLVLGVARRLRTDRRHASHGGCRGACRGRHRGLHRGLHRRHRGHSGGRRHVSQVGLGEVEQPRHL